MHINDAGSGGFAPTQTQVDVQGLQDFVDVLQNELDANFRPNRDVIATDHRAGVGFGLRHASVDMHLAVAKYHECLTRALSNLDAHVRASEILIAATHNVIATYRSAEELSGARLADLEQSLQQAVGVADAEQTAARRRSLEEQGTRMENRGLL